MPPIPASRHFEIVSAALALAEERTAIPLAEVADAIGVSVEQLRELLDPVLYLEFYDSYGELISHSSAFFLDVDNDVLQVDSGHWLRDWDASPPSRDAALRLLVAAATYQAEADRRSPDLDRALAKLRRLVAMEMVLSFETPPCLEVARRAWLAARSLRFRYVKWKDDQATEREVLPWDVYAQWGHWYVHGPEVAGGRPKQWRVDRMDGAELGDVTFERPEELDRPEWFDLTERQRRVTVRLPEPLLAALPQPHTVLSQEPDGDGFVRADLELAGDRHLDHLLVALGPDGEVLEPEEYRERRRAWAETLLATLDA
ncbi:MAG: WYL domain-containing protein [Actinobacteria bacterium]|nr:WYL domain-containing protein [Actinomycetota bacterium]